MTTDALTRDRCCSPARPASSGWSCSRACSSRPTATSSRSCAPPTTAPRRRASTSCSRRSCRPARGRTAGACGRWRPTSSRPASGISPIAARADRRLGRRRSCTARRRSASRCRSTRPARSTSRARARCVKLATEAHERGVARALRPRLDGVRRGRPHRAASASTTATSGRAFATRTSARSSRPSSSSPTAGCRPRSCARASSSATAPPAGRRPSTSSTGRCRRSRAGCFRRVPGDPGASLDIVPVDTVADALLELLRGPVRGGAFHVVAGDERRRTPSSRRWPPRPSTPSRRVFVALGEDEQAEKLAGALVPYFSVRCTFDARRAPRAARRDAAAAGESTSRRSCATPARRSWGKRRRRAGTRRSSALQHVA